MNKTFYNKIKKTMSAILAATVSLSMMAATPVYADWVENANNAEEVAITDDIFEIQRRACEAHELLYASFDWNETYIYPDDFAGDFIDYDTLHVQVTDETAIDYYKDLLSEYSDAVVYDIVDYSYNELQQFTQNYAEELEHEYEIISYCVDVKNNQCEIDVLRTDFAEVLALTNDIATYDGNNINISVEAIDNYQDEVSIIAGNPIKYPTAGTVTLGGSGSYNGATAFLSCGHGTSVGEQISFGNSTIGTVTINQNLGAGNRYGDYSIITATSGYTATSSVLTSGGGATSFNGYMLNPAVGTYVYKYGRVSGQAYCEVTKTNVTVSNGTLGLTKAKIITGSSTGGDSGGPYRCDREFCGVHKGSSTSGSTQYVYFTPYTYIYNRGFIIDT